MRTNIKIFVYILLTAFFSKQLISQNRVAQKERGHYSIKGEVIDKISRQPVSFATVSLWKTSTYATTDTSGKFSLDNLDAGMHRIQIDILGYNQFLSEEVMLSISGEYVVFEIEEQSRSLDQITVRPKADPFKRIPESPLSQRSIGIQEIERNAGANRDISRVINSLPGVASATGSSYRNDILVRGGGPSENKFYLDGIEIPTINHFSTQGASGGPAGILDADFIREVDFYAGSFPANKANALSSIMDIKLKDGDPVTNKFKVTVGASEAGASANGHFNNKTSYLFSARASYLQFLFKALNLPFLPIFTDAQFKIKTRFSNRQELSFIGLMGIDDTKLNSDTGGDESREYILSYLPVIKQEVFTLGAVYRNYYGPNSLNIYLSHSYLNNRNIKYRNNDESSESNLVLNYKSVEQETKLRIENISKVSNFRITAGIGAEMPYYTNNTYQKIFTGTPVTINYETGLRFVKYGLFASGNYTSGNKQFSATMAFRIDGNSYSKQMSNPFNQFSPRVSVSYQLFRGVNINGSVGRYYQLPPFTALGFKNTAGDFVNKELKYMGADHFVVGLEYKPSTSIQLTLEGFYKKYFNGLYSVNDSIPVAGKGTSYGAVGNEELTSDVNGRAYGIELSTRIYVNNKFNLIGSVTLFRSQFESRSGTWDPQSWDNRRLMTLSGNYKLPSNFNVGFKYRYSGGNPYTPYDEYRSSLVAAWDVSGRPYINSNSYNSEYLPYLSQLDLRLDKDFYFRKFALKLYLDIQNVLNAKYKNQDVLVSTGRIINPGDPYNLQRYEMKNIIINDGTVLPTIGITVEF